MLEGKTNSKIIKIQNLQPGPVKAIYDYDRYNYSTTAFHVEGEPFM